MLDYKRYFQQFAKLVGTPEQKDAGERLIRKHNIHQGIDKFDKYLKDNCTMINQLIKASIEARSLEEFGTMIEYLEDMFFFQSFQAIMDFGHDTFNHTEITEQATKQLNQNLFTYLGAYVRRADLFPSTNG
ncbi:hypothetical protein EDC01DRAFT_635775 [Geopyxis carbonaria]|nr:hypothetical protein EDC01DRAFT_635775 [Geopyxis carbonaria]